MIESALAQSGFTPVLCTQAPGGMTEDEYVDMLLDRQVSGIVVIAGLHADTTASRERSERLVQRPLVVRGSTAIAAGRRAAPRKAPAAMSGASPNAN